VAAAGVLELRCDDPDVVGQLSSLRFKQPQAFGVDAVVVDEENAWLGADRHAQYPFRYISTFMFPMANWRPGALTVLTKSTT
jgi:hypothetical protein